MSELRYNPLDGTWVVIAGERALRPEQFSKKTIAVESKATTDPFLPGNEAMTPPEVYALGPENRQPDTPGWEIRVVPNKFPALNRDVIPEGEFMTEAPGRLVSRAYGYGAHEVVISSPDPHKSIGQLDQTQVEHLINTYQMRRRVLAKDKLCRYIQLICNHGKAAGASLEHPHAQLFALPFVPQRIEQMAVRCTQYRKAHKQTIQADLLNHAAEQNLILMENDHFIILSPPWAASPFEMWIVPREPGANFDEIDEGQRQSLAQSLRLLLNRLWNKLDDPPYNFYIVSAPCVHDDKARAAYDDLFWYLVCVPRVSTPGGFEYATGVFINTVSPEQAVEALRP